MRCENGPCSELNQKLLHTSAFATGNGFHRPTVEGDGIALESFVGSDAENKKKRRGVPKRLKLGPELARVKETARRALANSCPGALGDERILHDLCAGEVALASVIADAQLQIALRLQLVVDDPRLAMALAKTLRDVTAVASAVSRRVRETLLAAASLRAQRRMLQQRHQPAARNDD